MIDRGVVLHTESGWSWLLSTEVGRRLALAWSLPWPLRYLLGYGRVATFHDLAGNHCAVPWAAIEVIESTTAATRADEAGLWEAWNGTTDPPEEWQRS